VLLGASGIDYYPPTLAAVLGRGAREGARAAERWSAGFDWKPPRRARGAHPRPLRTATDAPGAPPHGQPLDELILTVLSQATNDRNRDVAFAAAARPFGSWKRCGSTAGGVEEAIRPGGISKVKSERIQQILRAIGEPLPRRPPGPAGREAERASSLCRGVGKKTARRPAVLVRHARRAGDTPRVTRRHAAELLRPGAGLRRAARPDLAVPPPGRSSSCT